MLAGLTLASCNTATQPSSLYDVQGDWQLQSFELAGGNTTKVPNPGKYTIRFDENDAIHLRADCNRCNGQYEKKNGTELNISLLACTLAYCGPDSLDSQYLRGLGATSSFQREAEELLLIFSDGIMRFRVSP
jgi:heat shock protein HslJ